MPLARNAMYTFLCAGLVAIAACSQPAAPTPAIAASTPGPAQTTTGARPPAYTPPSADQVYQMVAPIALFPDRLVAQVLAGATYPGQITAANTELEQNPNLRGAPLQTAIAQQPWDPSVKGLTAFPTVLEQMAKNIDWTSALGEAYVNDPTDVMNAIQVMRQRASAHGSLRSSPQLRVNTQTAVTQPNSYVSDPGDPVYAGPAVIPAPSQIIEIEPAEQDTVYVPQYNPQVVYGEQVPYYPGYSYQRPSEYSRGDVLAVGAIGFGAGILVGALFEHHNERASYGWNNWGMNWSGDGGGGYGGNDRGTYAGGDQRPAVVYNNSTYVSRSNTVVNHDVISNNNSSHSTINNIDNSKNSRNTVVPNRNAGNAPVTNNSAHTDQREMENGRPNDAANRDRSATPKVAVNPTQRGPQLQSLHVVTATNPPRPNAAAARPPMSMPHFNGVPQRGVNTAESERAFEHAGSNSARVSAENLPRVTANAALTSKMVDHANSATQRLQAEPADVMRQPANRKAQPPHIVALPARVEHYTQPSHADKHERQMQERPAPHPMAAPRPVAVAVARQQPAPRPPPQAPHNDGSRPAPTHPAPSHNNEKHDHR